MNSWYDHHWRSFYARRRTLRAYTSSLTLLTLFKGTERAFVQRCLTLLDLHPGDRVVDLCCGTGRLTYAVAKAVSPTGLALGIDLSQAMLAKVPDAGDLPLRLKLIDATRTDLDPESFDVATIIAALHEMPYEHRRDLLAEARRILRPHGRLLIGEHHVDIRAPLRSFQRLMFALVATRTERATFGDLLRRRLTSEVADAGFVIRDCVVLPRRLFQLLLAEKIGLP